MVVLSSHIATLISLAVILLTTSESVDAAAIYTPRQAAAFSQRDDATLKSRAATATKTVIIQMFEWTWDRCVH